MSYTSSGLNILFEPNIFQWINVLATRIKQVQKVTSRNVSIFSQF